MKCPACGYTYETKDEFNFKVCPDCGCMFVARVDNVQENIEYSKGDLFDFIDKVELTNETRSYKQ